MKILKCTTCGTVMNTVHTDVIIGIEAKISKDGIFYADSTFDHVYGEPLTLISLDEYFFCHECDNRTVEIIEVETCPHVWEKGWSTTRMCRLCNETQQGKLVFE